MKFLQQSFQGGYNRLLDTTRIQRNEYPFLQNGRNRFDVIETIKKPLDITSTLPDGNFQGLYAAGNFTLVFIDGRAYYRNYAVSGQFVAVADLALSPDVDKIYVELVPASTINLVRKNSSDTDVSAGILYSGSTATSPSAVVVQDGINQPWIIQPNGIARITKKYTEWTPAAPEYVPIGKQMLHHDGILYIVSPDGTQIYRSVTGRPLDFMIKIDKDGNALSEESGKADTISHKVSFDAITAIRWINTPTGAFFVSTSYNSYLVTPLYDNLIFGEPRFKNTLLFNTGAQNQFCLVDVLGDTALIDFTGVKSFNAAAQITGEGKNSPFSANVAHLFKDVQQSEPSCIEFDNYALFAVNTVYGQRVLVYDALSGRYVGLDNYTIEGTILQFASVKTNTERKLLAYTSANKLYELFGGTEREECAIYIGDFCSNDPQIMQKPIILFGVFIDAEESGTVHALCYTDRLAGNSYDSLVKEAVSSNTLPLEIPFGKSTNDRCKVFHVDLAQEAECWKYGFLISWDFDAKLSHLAVISNDIEKSTNQIALDAQGTTNPLPQLEDVAWSGGYDEIITLRGSQLFGISKILVDNVDCRIVGFSSNSVSFVVPFVALGEHTLKCKLVDDYEVELGTITIT